MILSVLFVAAFMTAIDVLFVKSYKLNSTRALDEVLINLGIAFLVVSLVELLQGFFLIIIGLVLLFLFFKGRKP